MHIRWVFALWFSLPRYSLATSKCYNVGGNAPADWVVVYKVPAQNAGKALIAGARANAWQNIADVTRNNGHAVYKPLEHVIAENNGNKFIANNNIPPDVPKVKTKSNSKGVLMMNPNNVDEASWIVHTIPGFPKALTGYVFPPAEIQKGHLFICLTIKESEID
ncbi:Deoxyribonuclease-2-alpha, partial [Trichinella sp. T6]